MKKAVLFAVLMGTLTLCLALSSIGMSPVLTIDTVDPEIEIFNPAGGELWYIGDSHDIQWTATDTNLMEDEIDIWYSLNGGSDYTALAMSIFNSGTQPWEIPAWQTQSAKIRVDAIDSFGNTASQNSNSFKIGYVPPAIPTGISVNITNEIDALISWDAVTHTIPPYNTPITPDGYIILYNESPYEYDEH
ncbi:MAG: hypothetical protein GX135_04890, partial [Candidatus Cloacimonetes bacterium]|nr:hypothetical protein [Candidatus Cloacimonadota bacterium]